MRGRSLIVLALVACSSGDKDSATTSGSPGGTSAGTPTGTISSCFTAETPVHTPTGPVAIADLEVGDAVWAWDVDRERPVVRPVTALHERIVGELVLLDLGDRTVETTAEHPFLSLSEDAWVEAADLVPGEALAAWTVEGLVPERLSGVRIVRERVTVYNLTVGAPEHDYFAGGVLVHNKSEVSFDVTWTDDGAVPTDTDGDGVVDSGCGDVLSIQIQDPLGVSEWWVGVADPAGGWTGEDCLNGQGASAFCHGISQSRELTQVCTEAEVVDGQTTLHHAGREDQLTWMFEDPNQYCFVFGADVSYYAALGCFEIQ